MKEQSVYAQLIEIMGLKMCELCDDSYDGSSRGIIMGGEYMDNLCTYCLDTKLCSHELGWRMCNYGSGTVDLFANKGYSSKKEFIDELCIYYPYDSLRKRQLVTKTLKIHKSSRIYRPLRLRMHIWDLFRTFRYSFTELQSYIERLAQSYDKYRIDYGSIQQCIYTRIKVCRRSVR